MPSLVFFQIEDEDDNYDDNDEPEEIDVITDPVILTEIQAFENQVIDGLFDQLHPKTKPHVGKNDYTYVLLSEPGGSKILYKGDGWAHHFEPQIKKTGWTNAADGNISGKNNVKNIWVHLDKKHDRFPVRDGDGTIRIYTRKSKQHKERFEQGKTNHHVRNYLLREERKPSGNRVLYSYSKKNRLIGIKTVNARKTKTLNWSNSSIRTIRFM